ncbi:MAG: hypothetical protein ACOZCE_07880 [Spirochaetota bacterium]|jgi:hypothetical protein|nr:hypothetical protein [Treponema sp.]
MKRWLCIGFFVIAAVASLAAQSAASDELDGLFATEQDMGKPAQDTQTSSDHTAQYTERQPLELSGSLSATGGIAIGYTQWPELDEPLKYYDGSAGGTAQTTLVFRAKPSSVLSLYGDVSSSLDTNTTTFAWSSFSIGSLFFDYYGLSLMSLRAGKFTTTWGHGRIFSASNVMSSSSGDISLRLNFPLVLQGLSFFILANSSYFETSGSTPAVSEYAYAGIIDQVFGPLRVTQGVRYQKREGLKSVSSIQGTLFGVDVFSDITFVFPHVSLDSFVSWTFLGGAFKEYGQTKIYGEYIFDSSTASAMDHTLAFVYLQRNIWSKPIDGGFKWEHTFYDNSGQITPGLTWRGLPNGSIQIVLPITYGTETSRYVIKNKDPSKRRITLVILAKIEGSF